MVQKKLDNAAEENGQKILKSKGENTISPGKLPSKEKNEGRLVPE